MIKKEYSLLLLIFISSNAYSQANFIEGYIITNKLDTLFGLIDYQQWDKNPTEILFKSNQTTEVTHYYPTQVHAFFVAGDFYESKRITIYKSSLKVDELSFIPADAYQTEIAFVMCFVKGAINLYYLKDQNGRIHFFVQKDTALLETLVNHKYYDRVNGRKVVVENHEYRKQLAKYFDECVYVRAKLNDAKYKTADLHELIAEYHTCISTPYYGYYNTHPKEQSHQFSLIAGMSYSSLSFKTENTNILSKTKFDYSFKPTFGLSYSYFLPRKRQKISFYNELLYRSYYNMGRYKDAANEDIYNLYTTEFDMLYIQVSNLVRYHFIVDRVRPFVNAGIANGFAIKAHNNTIIEEYRDQSLDTSERPALKDIRNHEQSWIIGFGMNYQHFSGEIRFQRSNAMSAYSKLNSSSNILSALFSYSF